jgi:hypothetical protein
MALLSGQVPTLPELMKLLTGGGQWAKSVDMMRQANEILDVMTWMPCNSGDEHMVLQSISLPSVYEAMINKGILPSDGADTNLYYPTATFRTWQEVDADAAEATGDPAKVMADKSRKHRQAHARNFVSSWFYGNSLTDPDAFPGMAQAYSNPNDQNGQNIIDGGGTGSVNASIWLIGFGEDAITGIYPEHSMAGLQTEDKGKVTKNNDGGVTDALRDVYRAKFSWKCGLDIEDWKWAARACNIDVNNILAQNASAANLLQMTEDMLYCLPSTAVMTDANTNGRRMGWFMNRTMRKMIDRQSRQAVMVGGQLDYVVVDGVRRKALHGIPMYTVDQLTNSEARVVGSTPVF